MTLLPLWTKHNQSVMWCGSNADGIDGFGRGTKQLLWAHDDDR